MANGIKSSTLKHNYSVTIYNAKNSAKAEIEAVVKAINDRVDGIVISPTNSSACVTLLKLAKKANIPVVISDIGTDEGEYVSYISSDNRTGAYELGKILAKQFAALGWKEGRVGIVAIPQSRKNGQLRTSGFMQAMDESGIKGADLQQQVQWSEEETYRFSKEMIDKSPDLRAIWLQGSDRYRGALRAIRDSHKEKEIVLLTFDAEPEFIELIQNGTLLGAAMQQPYLMGETAVDLLIKHLSGKKVKKNIVEKLPIIYRNVLGISRDNDD
jgi:ribose transport system substrate-binding protein